MFWKDTVLVSLFQYMLFKKEFLRVVPFYYFNIKITSAQNHRILVEVYGEHALAQFKSGDFGLKVEKRSG